MVTSSILFVPNELETVIQKSTPERAGEHCCSTDRTRHISVKELSATIYLKVSKPPGQSTFHYS